MKYVVDKDVCIGCGLCCGTCPQVFEMTDEGTARALDVDAESAAADGAEAALESCPVSAIRKA